MNAGKLVMTGKTDGWVVFNISHPSTGNKYIVGSTFSFTRSGSIKKFIEGSGNSWKYWKDKYNFRCERATQTIECFPKSLYP